jgi:hypothetical protein
MGRAVGPQEGRLQTAGRVGYPRRRQVLWAGEGVNRNYALPFGWQARPVRGRNGFVPFGRHSTGQNGIDPSPRPATQIVCSRELNLERGQEGGRNGIDPFARVSLLMTGATTDVTPSPWGAGGCLVWNFICSALSHSVALLE